MKEWCTTDTALLYFTMIGLAVSIIFAVWIFGYILFLAGVGYQHLKNEKKAARKALDAKP